MKKLFYFTLLFISFSSMGQINPSLINTDLFRSPWPSKWITAPNASPYEYGVYHFRKEISISEKPKSFIVHVTADNRYRLFVNGTPVSSGPARSDLKKWKYESIDIAPYLKQGKNVLASIVWNMGEHRPMAQMSFKTGFLMQGNSINESIVNTSSKWKVLKNEAFSPLPLNLGKLRNYFAIGSGDIINGNKFPWGWQETNYDDSNWSNAVETIYYGSPRATGTDMQWMLVPREIPQMEETLLRIPTIKKSNAKVSDAFLKGKDVVFPKSSRIVILLDQTYLTTAYPELLISGGKNSKITLSYAKALMDSNLRKGNRNEIENRELIGFSDQFISDGGQKRLFRTLWFKTYRYLQLEIETFDEPLIIHDFYGIFTAYPFKENASFDSDLPVLKDIWNVGWRTARLCANELYFDCPYYEQLQYVGDTRIQALISLYVSGDDRLMRNAIDLINSSRFADGLTYSRYPSYEPQVIPPFSLFWVDMVHDYWMHRKDDAFIKSQLNGIDEVLGWYEKQLDKNGILGPMKWWNFVDWPNEWEWDTVARMGGIPAGVAEGNSSIISLQFVYALERAADLNRAFGRDWHYNRYKTLAESIKKEVYNSCWDESKQLLADTPEKKIFSQHANILGILTDAVPLEKQNQLFLQLENDTTLIQTTLYFKFYMNEALRKVGLADRYVDLLGPWHEMLKAGLTTFAERPDPTRSDCHAWSASPNYHFLSIVCGIMPSAPGFEKVSISPSLGKLKMIKGKLPHPKGEVFVKLAKKGKEGIEGEINLPEGVTGDFFWKGKKIVLRSGLQKINI